MNYFLQIIIKDITSFIKTTFSLPTSDNLTKENSITKHSHKLTYQSSQQAAQKAPFVLSSVIQSSLTL